MRAAILLLFSGLVTANAQQDVVRAGPGVTAPRLLSKVEPEYSFEGREAHIQGTVVFQIVVDEQGRPADISVLSPLGFGLDERAQAAIEKWRFAPGTKDGKPVRVLVTVDVNFRFPGSWFDEKAESRRTKFNLALEALRSHDTERADQAVKTIEDLARQNYPAAMDLLGRMMNAGQYVEKNPDQGVLLIAKAADKNYGLAVFDLGLLYLEGARVPRDTDKGLKLIRDAALMGSTQAQYHLGQRYEEGSTLPRDAERARYYYRLCAARGDSKCQLHLGKLLLDLPAREERDYVQAVAWLQLAADRGNGEAKAIAKTETAKLTQAQEDWVNKLKGQLAAPAVTTLSSSTLSPSRKPHEASAP
jgi:TonB family protein